MDSAAHHGYGGNSRFLKRHMVSPREKTEQIDTVRQSSLFPGLLRNVPVLEHAAAGRGLFTIKPERDGIVRRVPMIMLAQGQTMPSLTFEMLRVATGSGTILIKAEQGGIKSLGIKGVQIPTDHNGQIWVHYARNDASIYVPAINVLEKETLAQAVVERLLMFFREKPIYDSPSSGVHMILCTIEAMIAAGWVTCETNPAFGLLDIATATENEMIHFNRELLMASGN